MLNSKLKNLRWLALTSAFSLYTLALLAQTTPINRGKLVSNLDGGNKSITNLSSLTTTGTVTAIRYVGSGSNLTDIASGTVTSVAGDTNFSIPNSTTTPVITFSNYPAGSAGPFARSNTTGNFSVSGQIGVGTTVPMDKLEVIGNIAAYNNGNNPTIKVGDVAGNSVMFLGYDSAADFGSIQSYAGGAVGKLVLNGSGANVAIGTTTGPELGRLEVQSLNQTIASGVGQLSLLTSDAQAIDKGGSIILGGVYNGGTAPADFANVSGRKENGTVNNLSGYLAFSTRANGGSSTEKMRITSTGNVIVAAGTLTAPGGFISQTTTGNAPAGGLGEYVSALLPLGSAVSLTTATAANVTNISLTAGDWDVRGNVNYSEAGVTVTETVGGVTTTSATIPTDGSEVYSGAGIGAIGLSAKDSVTLPSKRISLSGTTAVYLVGKSTFSVGTVSAYGTITARRVQ